MYVESKRRGRLAPAFGLALAVTLVVAAAMASAATASTWHIDGATFSGEESVSWSGGPIKVSRPEWGATISCGTVSGTTKIKESSKSSGTITLGSCSVVGAPKCTVKPLNLSYEGYLVDSGGQAYERYNKLSGKWWIGGECALGEGTEIPVEGSTAAAVGVPDAVKSPRVFSATAESATGSKGLVFDGGYWQVTGEPTQALAGKNAGKDFGTGVGGTWKPEAATWYIGSSPFSGTEEFSWSEGSEPIYLAPAVGSSVECTESITSSGEISGGDESAVEVTFYECGIATAPNCSVGNVYLTLDGQIGRQYGAVLEKADASGEWEMYGTGCPFTGTKQISGSVGAFLYTEGLTLRRGFGGEATDGEVKATGLRLNGETWGLFAEPGASLTGPNAGKSFDAA